RLGALELYARLTSGPIIVSFLGIRRAEPRFARLRRYLPRRHGRVVGDRFSVGIGFYHHIAEAELRDLADAGGLKVVYTNFDERDTNWPHAVLMRSSKEG